MEAFTDSEDKKRCLSLTIGRARKAAKTLDIDFIDGDPAELSSDLNLKPLLQVDLIWFLLDDKDDLEQEAFEEKYLDGLAFGRAKTALFAEVENFIQSVRPEMLPVFKEATLLMSEQITQSVQTAVSLFQSKEVKEEFLKANADVVKSLPSKIQEAFGQLSGKSPEGSE